MTEDFTTPKIQTFKCFDLPRCLGVLLIAACVSSCAMEVGDPQEFETRKQKILLGSDGRTPITNLTWATMALGRLDVPHGTCTGVVIGPRKVMTAATCVDGLAPDKIKFRYQLGVEREGLAARDATVERYIQGFILPNPYTPDADWALLTLNENLSTLPNYGHVTLGNLTQSTAENVGLMGYHNDGYKKRPAQQWGCRLTMPYINEVDLVHNCDTNDGSAGGPIFLGGYLVGINNTPFDFSGYPYDEAPDSYSNFGVNLRHFRFVPDRVEGLATTNDADGRRIFWASDSDNERIVRRTPGSGSGPFGILNPWEVYYSGAAKPRGMGGTNLEDGRQQVWLVNGSGELWQTWENSIGGSWANWKTQSIPTKIYDLAVTGGKGKRTQLFMLGEGGSIYTTYKMGGSSSAWASWSHIGSLPGAHAISAVEVNGEKAIFVAAAVRTAATLRVGWGDQASFGSWNTMASNYTYAVSAASDKNGKAHFFAVVGGVLKKFSESANRSWQLDWEFNTQDMPVNAQSLIKLEALDDKTVLAVTSYHELYQLTYQNNSLGFKRFYL